MGLRRNGPDLVTLELPKFRYLRPRPTGILKNISEVITSILRNIQEKQRLGGIGRPKSGMPNTHTHTHTHTPAQVFTGAHAQTGRHPEGLLRGNNLQQCHLVGAGAVLPSEVPEGAQRDGPEVRALRARLCLVRKYTKEAVT